MRLLLDENLSPLTAEHLRILGHDVRRISILEIGQRLDDAAVVSRAASENRYLLSLDVKLGERFISCEFVAPGMLVFRVKDQKPENINQLLSKFLSRFTNKDAIQGNLHIITERKIRIRKKG